jgi:hypothetical protein
LYLSSTFHTYVHDFVTCFKSIASAFCIYIHPLSLLQIAHMKKEIEAIRAKDIAQGGLTQGQQTQIARNEQRMTQVKLYSYRSVV